jgi:hypothetical protein
MLGDNRLARMHESSRRGSSALDCPLIYWTLATEEAKWMIIEATRFLGVSVRVKA